MSKGLEELRRAKYYIGQVMIRDKEIANNKLLNCLCDFEKSCITIEKELNVLEIIKKKGIKLIIPNNDLSNEHIDIQIFTNTLSKDELELIKKELKL